MIIKNHDDKITSLKKISKHSIFYDGRKRNANDMQNDMQNHRRTYSIMLEV